MLLSTEENVYEFVTSSTGSPKQRSLSSSHVKKKQLVFLPAATKLGQGNVFTGVCDSVHGGEGGLCLSASWDTPPPRSRHPQQTPPREQTSPWEQTPWSRSPGSRHPKEQTPPQEQTPPSPLGAEPPREQTPPGADPPGSRPPREADSGIRSMSGRYASYWNAFLL